MFDILLRWLILAGIIDLKIQDNGDQRLSTDNFVVPFEQNHQFTGRKIILEALKQKLFDQAPKKHKHRVALYGMGGIGKTQTALEYVYTNRDSYERIYWITAVDQASLLSGYQKIAIKAGLKRLLNLKPVEIAKGVLSWLRQKQSWLLVIHNLDDINVVAGFLPQPGPHNHDYDRNHREVPQWIPQGNRSYPHSVATTWSMSFKIVYKNNSQAGDLFRLLLMNGPHIRYLRRVF